MNIKNALAIGIFVTAASAMALDSCKVTIENVTARQRYPWNGKVDISFEVVGDPTANLPDGKFAKLAVSMMDRTTGKSYAAENVTGDIEPTEGLHHVIWDLTEQGVEVYASNAVFAVGYEAKDSLYRVIDVSDGSTAEEYPASFLDVAPAGGWSDEYKTDKIILRRIEGTNGVYYAGVFEVTEAQWDKVMGGSSTSTKPKGSVSYNTIRGDEGSYDWPSSNAVDPESFMGRLRQKTGLATLDLPSEAEWEYAGRSGVTTKWLCGDSETGLDEYAWYSVNSGRMTHPVGALRANAWGLYDVHGNVWEWCLDWYHNAYSGGRNRVLRGGAHLNDAEGCAFAYRIRFSSSKNPDFYGFRLFCRPESNGDDDERGGVEIICKAESPETFVDSWRGIRYDSGTNAVHTLNWDATWVGGDDTAEVVITDGETELARVTGAGSCVWTNAVLGLHTLTYTTIVGGVVQPDVYTAAYFCLGEVGVSHVTARQIQPWTGLVEISYDLSEGVGMLSQVTNLFTRVCVTDNDTGISLVARTFTRPPTYEKGRHLLIWDASADDVSLKMSSASFSVAVTGEIEPTYCVIDVSGGSTVERYPVSSLDAVPKGGWDDDYKTDKIVLRRIDGMNGVYYAGIFEVTGAQWCRVMGESSASTYPMASVSYNSIRGDGGAYDWIDSDAVDSTSFMGRLRQKTGLVTLDLPSVAEWEYAARAGVTTEWLCGGNDAGLGDYAWYKANSYGRTCPVGTRRANAWGLYDVHGNVHEWCLGSGSYSRRATCGGSVSSDAYGCRLSEQCGDHYANNAYSDTGFRLFRRSESNDFAPRAFYEDISKAVSIDLRKRLCVAEEGEAIELEYSPLFSTEPCDTVLLNEIGEGVTNCLCESTTAGAWPLAEQTSGGNSFELVFLKDGVEVGVRRWVWGRRLVLNCADVPLRELYPETYGSISHVTLAEEVTEVSGGFFEGCTNLVSVTIPNGVTSIGRYVFAGCSGLASVTIPDGVTSIGRYAFSGCSGLASVTIPDGVTSIGDSAFSGCSGLTSVTIPDSVTSIGWSAFSGCRALMSVAIPDGVTSIGNSAFSGCSALTSVTIPDGVRSIGYLAFKGCSSLVLVTIPDSVTYIGMSAFEGCSGLTSVAIPDGVTSIESSMFSGCSGLTSVTIPVGVTSIGWGAFFGCSGLTSVTIPDGVTSIWDSAFSGCSGLTSVTIPDGVTSIGSSTFFGCSGLTSMTIPDGVTNIGGSAFKGCSGLTAVTIPNSVTTVIPFGQSRLT